MYPRSYRVNWLVMLASILLIFHSSNAAIHHSASFKQHQHARFTRFINKNRNRNPLLLATGVPVVEKDYSNHRIVSLDEEPNLFHPNQHQDEDTEQETESPRITAWRRFFTKPTQSVWPLESTSPSLSKVPLSTKEERNDETTKEAVQSDDSPPAWSFQKEYSVNETAVNEFMSTEPTKNEEKDEGGDVEAPNQADEPQRPLQLDISNLAPALALPSSLSFSSIRTKLSGMIRHPHFTKYCMTGIQVGLAIYLLNAIVQAAADVLEEVGGGDSSPHLLKVDQVQQILASLETSSSNTNNANSAKKQPTTSSLLQQQPTLHHLTNTLLTSGMPLRSDDEENSIERVLLSLTRSEALILQQCLWIPSDNASFSNIAGLQSIKQSLLDLVWTIKSNSSPQHQQLNPYSHLVEHPPGILLYGPPGCGKTMLVKALAANTTLPCLVVTPSVLLRKYVGDTNLQVRALFSLAQKLSPCILCIDELDGLFRERSSTEHDVSRDLKTEFLQYWDGISSRGKILVVGATNRPFEVDSAVLRRMPQSYFVGLPNYQARKDLLASLLNSIPTSSDIKLHPLASETEGYTPSDLRQVVRMAITLGPIREARFSLKYRPLANKDVGQARALVSPTPLTPGYRAALIHYNEANQNGNPTSRQQSSPNNNSGHAWDSFFNAGTIHASHGTTLQELSPDNAQMNGAVNDEYDDHVDEYLEDDYSYDQEDESESDNDDEEEEL